MEPSRKEQVRRYIQKLTDIPKLWRLFLKDGAKKKWKKPKKTNTRMNMLFFIFFKNLTPHEKKILFPLFFC